MATQRRQSVNPLWAVNFSIWSLSLGLPSSNSGLGVLTSLSVKSSAAVTRTLLQI